MCEHIGKKEGSIQPHFSLVPTRLKSPAQCHADSVKAGAVVLPVANGIAHQIAHVQFLSPFVVRVGSLANRRWTEVTDITLGWGISLLLFYPFPPVLCPISPATSTLSQNFGMPMQKPGSHQHYREESCSRQALKLEKMFHEQEKKLLL